MIARRFAGALVLFGAVAVAGCSKETEGSLVTPNVVAGLRYFNIVPDTGSLDIRVVDVVEDAPNTINATFRTPGLIFGLPSTGAPMHTAVAAGNRRIRVFNNSTNPAVSSVILLDTIFNFQANVNYTMYLYGFARTGSAPSMRAIITDDTPPTIPAGQVAVRVINLAPDLQPTITSASADVYIDALALGTAPAGAATFGGVAPAGASAYQLRATGAARAAATETGGTTQLLNASFPAGAAGTSTTNPTPGVTVAGTAISVILVPRSVAGSSATSFTTPGIVFWFDQLPPRTAP
jgi:hypothetical protein